VTVNTWHTTVTKPPKDKHVWVWWGVEVQAYWTGKVWRDVATGKVLQGVEWWRE
jgi:hypothetical protein